MEHRDTIGMAKGVLMERYDVDAGAAFAILRRASQRSNTKLVKVATELVDRHSATASNQSRGGAVPNIAALVETDLDLKTEPRSSCQRRRPPSLRTASGDGEGSNPVGAQDNVPKSPYSAEQYAVTGEVLVVACGDLDLPDGGGVPGFTRRKVAVVVGWRERPQPAFGDRGQAQQAAQLRQLRGSVRRRRHGHGRRARPLRTI